MAEDEDFTSREGLIVGLIAFGAILVLIITLIISNTDTPSISLPSWGLAEWSTLAIGLLIVGSIGVAIYWGSDEYGEDDVFEGGYGFPATILILLVAILMVNTQFFGLAIDNDKMIDTNGDGIGDTRLGAIPSGYVDYGEPQPYGFGNYGPVDEGILTDFEGLGAGCIIGGVIGGIVGGAFSWGFGAAPSAAIGCGLGGGAGFVGSAGDFDGDPTTGW